VSLKVAVIYNDPTADRYHSMGESKAELGVMDEVKAVSEALEELKYPFILVPLHPPLEEVRKILQILVVDVVFNLFEGFDGCTETEGQVAAMLEELNIPFTGCPSTTLSLAIDKGRTKALLDAAGVDTPRFQVLTPDTIPSLVLDFPLIVKPQNEDASHGISEDSVVYDLPALDKQLRKICDLFGGRALVEEYVDGREFNTCVMGNGKLTIPAISEIVYTLPPDKPRVLTFDAKWEENSLYFINTKTVCPAPISPSEEQEISRIAKAAFKLVGARGYARVDFRQDRSGHFKVLEVNPNPDITPGSGAALQASVSGLTYAQFVEKVIRFAMRDAERLAAASSK
jgi:D-alanine-D-alanine ligase